MKKLIFLLISLVMSSIVYSESADYFPTGISSEWYTKHLNVMKEDSLFQMKDNNDIHVYRFLWVRTWGAPVSIRLDIDSKGKGFLTVKETSGQGGYEPGEIVKDYKIELTEEQISEFLNQLNKSNYWELPTKEKTLGLDGAQWIIEGVKEGQYHIVDRWSPKDGEFRDTALLLLKLSNLDTGDIY